MDKNGNVKILFISPKFHPVIGGIENVVLSLAYYLTNKGYCIEVLTNTPCNEPDNFPFKINRNLSFIKRLKLIRHSELQVYFNLNKWDFLPILFFKKPLIISLHGPISQHFLALIKKVIIKQNADAVTACSKYVGNTCKRSIIIHSGYDSNIFKKTNNGLRKKELIFLGRLVPEKGCHLLIHAVNKLKELGITVSLTIVGSGTEEGDLVVLSKKLRLASQISFIGVRQGSELSDILNQHQILVIPSNWEEPFGIVALEGIACGCMVIGSEKGGLKEAIGPCGITFPNGDVNALTEAIKKVLNHPKLIEYHQKFAPVHLQKHTQKVIAHEYLKVFEEVLAKKSNRIRI